MLNLLQAETAKVRHNSIISMVTIGILPIGAFVMLNLIIVLDLAGIWNIPMTVINGQEQVILALLFANQILSQALFIVFAAVSFGGESNWNTWKNIVPRNTRTRLVLAKVLVIAIGILLAIHTMAFLTYVGSWEIATILDLRFTNTVRGETNTGFWAQYLVTTVSLFTNFLIAALYASIASVISRSISGGVIFGLLFAFVESVIEPTMQFLSQLTRMDFLQQIPQFLPYNNVQNLMSWVTTGTSINRWPVLVSLAILIMWITALIGVLTAIFQKQDIR